MFRINCSCCCIRSLTCVCYILQTWHKACFRCEECNLLLTMKSYKGYNKLPYCNTYVCLFVSISNKIMPVCGVGSMLCHREETVVFANANSVCNNRQYTYQHVFSISFCHLVFFRY